jgi:hypothetical protein
MTMRTASCLCGGIRLRLALDALPPIQVCHCVQCRKAQGGAFAAVIALPRAALRLDSGAELLQAFESSAGKRRWFCKRCGSPLYSERDTLPDVLRVRAGLIDGPLDSRIAHHAYLASKADWWPLADEADGTARYDGPAPATPSEEP